MNIFLKFAFTLPTNGATRSSDQILSGSNSTQDEQRKSEGFFKRFWTYTDDISETDTNSFNGLL